MTIADIHKEHFVIRLKATEQRTELLMKMLLNKKHFKSYRKAEKSEDLNGIDWWVVYPGEKIEQPIQFKLRDKQQDIPIVRFYPFHGIDHEKTEVGRDFKGLLEGVSNQYYVATKTTLYRVPCNSLKKAALKLDENWKKAKDVRGDFSPEYFNAKMAQVWLKANIWNKLVFSDDGCEIWWKKNGNEKYPKFNMYIPSNKVKDWSFEFNDKDVQLLER